MMHRLFGQHRPLSLTPLLSLSLGLLLLAATNGARGTEEERIGAMLDDFHQAAAVADRDRYLNHFAENGVFMGTDDWERWPLDEFTAYVDGRFSTGTGWSYTSEERHVNLTPDGHTAWFDEVMVSARWGRFRGTGVVLLVDGNWKLAHYSLTALIPNESFEAVSAITNAEFEARRTTAEEN